MGVVTSAGVTTENSRKWPRRGHQGCRHDQTPAERDVLPVTGHQSRRRGPLAEQMVTSVGGAGHRRGAGDAVPDLVYRGHGKALSSSVGFASASAAATAEASFYCCSLLHLQMSPLP